MARAVRPHPMSATPLVAPPLVATPPVDEDAPTGPGAVLQGLLTDWPMFGLADDVRPALAEAVSHGRTVVLATLYAVSGGAPRAVGSQMTITMDGLCGFMSGGCIEGDLVAHAAEVMVDGSAQRIVYGEGGPYPDIRLVCGGRVDILLEALAPGDPAVTRLLDLTARRRPALWVSDGERRACWDADEAAPPWNGPLAEAARALASDPTATCVALPDGAAVGLRRNPVRRMIVVGGDPTALAIASLAVQSGFETWLLRPKGPQAPPPLPGVRYDRRDAERALPDIGLDAWTYVAVATHELEADEAALQAALGSKAVYVGVLGARRRLPERMARLRALGVSDADLARLKAPIGLDLGGKAPFEIAVAVLAQAIAQDASGARPHTA